MIQGPQTAAGQVDEAWQSWVRTASRYVVAPLVLLFSGFATTNFLLSGAYTWPRTSRIVALSLTVIILSYEFVYKEQRAYYPAASDARSVRAVVYSCIVPYALGCLAMLVLALPAF